MKRVFCAVLALLMLFSFAACGRSADGGTGWNPDDGGISDPWQIAGTGAEGAETVTSARTALNPLTGESNMPEDRVGMRPIGVSVNNIEDSLPQYGISKADYILEIETEGGITRLMCLFSDAREVAKIGSLRSLRDQFIEALYPIDPLIVHFGTSVYADAVLLRYNLRMLDAMQITPACWTDEERLPFYSTEHTKFTGGSAIEKGMELSKVVGTTKATATAFNFADETAPKAVPSEGTASAVKYFFYENDFYSYDGDFRYDAASGKYLKWQHGNPHVDAGADDKQLEFDNVILLFADIHLIEGQDKGLVKVEYDKGGKGYYFTQGHYESFEWSKADFMSNFSFKRADGTEIEINTGKTHMGIIRNEYEESFEITP